MKKLFLTRGALAAALALAWPAHAATDAELDQIRAQIRAMKHDYETRIDALEARLKAAEAKANAPVPVAAAPVAIAPAPASGTTSQGLAAFNPAISAILTGTYANLSRDPNQWRMAGFMQGGDVGPGKRGFSIGESELTLAANVDPLFSGALTFSITPQDTVSVEEAYGIYNAAPLGIVPKFGRFLSAVGYVNEQHAHAWDFVDAPLAYEAFLGGQYKTDGVQLRWIAPTEQFVELGGEFGSSGAFPGNDRNKNGLGSGVLFAHTGGDIGESASWLAGLSYLQTSADNRTDSTTDLFGTPATLGFTGRSRIASAQLTWKWAPHGNPHDRNLKVQGEYFWRRETGDLSYVPGIDVPVPSMASYASRQSGGYAQAVYQFMPLWRAGVRYDRLSPGTVDYGANAAFLATPSFHPERSTAMVDWTPSEFSRVRLQFAQAKLAPGFTDNEWFVQYILALGAHGAHKY